MKSVFILIVIIAIGLTTVDYRNKTKLSQVSHLQTNDPVPDIRVVLFRDISASVKNKGVENITSDDFKPFYLDTRRNIELNYGIIASSSARKLLTLQLPAWNHKKPTEPELSNYHIVGKAEVSEQYAKELRRYICDSQTFFKHRKAVIEIFDKEINTLILATSNESFEKGTDLTTAIDIADKVFNYSQVDSYQNYLVLLTDGIDSYSPEQIKLRNKATVIMVNAGKIEPTSVDSLISIQFQSIEQSISFILSKSNQSYATK